jgi:hypothetical protein
MKAEFGDGRGGGTGYLARLSVLVDLTQQLIPGLEKVFRLTDGMIDMRLRSLLRSRFRSGPTVPGLALMQVDGATLPSIKTSFVNELRVARTTVDTINVTTGTRLPHSC